jgi:phosphoribosylformylglycinamidine cyclo-ligase
MGGEAYRQAGVDLAASEAALELIRDRVRSTYTASVLAGIGSFGGLFRADQLRAMRRPVLVATTDGVGTKTVVAVRAGRLQSLGRDIVHHGVNDLLVQGASPLFCLDYLAMAELVPARVAALVEGVADACRELGVALLGGETAELPGVYQAGEIDLVATLVGAVEEDRIVDGRRLESGDLLIALASDGLHTNGYSLARRVFAGEDWNASQARLGGQNLFGALLAAHRCYLGSVRALMEAGLDLRGMAHITGGGLIDNLPRVLPPGIGAEIALNSWTPPALFQWLLEAGQLQLEEAFRVLNMGIGYLIALPAAQAAAALDVLASCGETAWVCGELRLGQGVRLR